MVSFDEPLSCGLCDFSLTISLLHEISSQSVQYHSLIFNNRHQAHVYCFMTACFTCTWAQKDQPLPVFTVRGMSLYVSVNLSKWILLKPDMYFLSIDSTLFSAMELNTNRTVKLSIHISEFLIKMQTKLSKQAHVHCAFLSSYICFSHCLLITLFGRVLNLEL